MAARIPGFVCVNENHENGCIHYSAEDGVSVFEDVQGPTRVFYAWAGTWDDHDAADKSPEFDDPEEAIGWVLDRL